MDLSQLIYCISLLAWTEALDGAKLQPEGGSLTKLTFRPVEVIRRTIYANYGRSPNVDSEISAAVKQAELASLTLSEATRLVISALVKKFPAIENVIPQIKRMEADIEVEEKSKGQMMFSREPSSNIEDVRNVANRDATISTMLEEPKRVKSDVSPRMASDGSKRYETLASNGASSTDSDEDSRLAMTLRNSKELEADVLSTRNDLPRDHNVAPLEDKQTAKIKGEELLPNKNDNPEPALRRSNHKLHDINVFLWSKAQDNTAKFTKDSNIAATRESAGRVMLDNSILEDASEDRSLDDYTDQSELFKSEESHNILAQPDEPALKSSSSDSKFWKEMESLPRTRQYLMSDMTNVHDKNPNGAAKDVATRGRTGLIKQVDELASARSRLVPSRPYEVLTSKIDENKYDAAHLLNLQSPSIKSTEKAALEWSIKSHGDLIESPKKVQDLGRAEVVKAGSDPAQITESIFDAGKALGQHYSPADQVMKVPVIEQENRNVAPTSTTEVEVLLAKYPADARMRSFSKPEMTDIGSEQNLQLVHESFGHPTVSDKRGAAMNVIEQANLKPSNLNIALSTSPVVPAKTSPAVQMDDKLAVLFEKIDQDNDVRTIPDQTSVRNSQAAILSPRISIDSSKVGTSTSVLSPDQSGPGTKQTNSYTNDAAYSTKQEVRPDSRVPAQALYSREGGVEVTSVNRSRDGDASRVMAGTSEFGEKDHRPVVSVGLPENPDKVPILLRQHNKYMKKIEQVPETVAGEVKHQDPPGDVVINGRGKDSGNGHKNTDPNITIGKVSGSKSDKNFNEVSYPVSQLTEEQQEFDHKATAAMSPVKSPVRPTYHWSLSTVYKGKVYGNPGNTIYLKGQVQQMKNVLFFDGRSGYLDVGSFEDQCLSDIDLCKKGLSVAITVKIDGSMFKSSRPRYIFDSGATDPNSRGISCYVNEGRLHAAVSASNGTWCTSFDAETYADKWILLVVSWSRIKGVQIYVNCDLAADSGQNGACPLCKSCHLTNINSFFLVGRQNQDFDFTKFWAGDLSVYEYTLNPSHVKLLCEANNGAELPETTKVDVPGSARNSVPLASKPRPNAVAVQLGRETSTATPIQRSELKSPEVEIKKTPPIIVSEAPTTKDGWDRKKRTRLPRPHA